MAYTQKNNEGDLWMEGKERQSQTGGTYMSYSGSCNIEGTSYWINGIKKTIKLKDGTEKEVMSLRFKPKDIIIQHNEAMPF